VIIEFYRACRALIVLSMVIKVPRDILTCCERLLRHAFIWDNTR